MGKYRKYWMETLVSAIRNYKRFKEDDSEQAQRIVYAVERALDEYTEEGDDPLKRRAIMMIYINGTHTRRGAAEKLNYSLRTVTRLGDEFILKVGEYAGYVGTFRPNANDRI